MLNMNLQFFAHKKGVGSTKNGRDSESKRLGAKRADGQFVKAGNILYRQRGLNIFLKNKFNPMIGAAGISAFPMSGRIVHKMALKEDPQNFLLMHSIGVNVSGQIASVIAGGIILNIAAKLMGG